MNISVMNSKDNWNIFSKNRNAIYGVAIISIMIFHFFEDISAIPRGSGNEKGLSDYLVKFAKDRNLWVYPEGDWDF